MKKTFTIFFFITNLLAVNAQTACFNTSDIEGCAPYSVQVFDCSNTGGNVFYNYGDGEGWVKDSTHVYSTPGNYMITQIAGVLPSIDTFSLPQQIRVVTNAPPEYSVIACSGKNISIVINDIGYDDYIIDYDDGTIISVKGGDTVAHTYADILSKTLTVTGTYQIAPCTNSESKSVTLFDNLVIPKILEVVTKNQDNNNGSVEIKFEAVSDLSYEIVLCDTIGDCSIIDTILGINGDLSYKIEGLNNDFKNISATVNTIDQCNNRATSDTIYLMSIDVNAVNNAFNINWSDYPAKTNYSTTNVTKGSTTFFSSNSVISTSDSMVICNKIYCYQAIAQINSDYYSGHQIKSLSIRKCEKAINNDSPPAVLAPHINVNNKKSVLNWTLPTSENIQNVFIYRSTNQAGYSNIISLPGNSNTFIDQESKADENEYCYYVTYKNTCNNTPIINNNSCNIYLNSEIISNEIVSNNWNNVLSYSNGIKEYILQIIDKDGETILESFSVGANNTYLYNELNNRQSSFYFRIKAFPVDQNDPILFSNLAFIKVETVLFFPNAFTPNNDGLNDTFKPVGREPESFEMFIFNRWGEMLFASQETNNGWNGMLGLTLVEQGVYSYRSKYTTTSGEVIRTAGTFNLLY